MNQEMAEKFRSAQGFIAALDQSGGSTPKALKLYGIEESEYSGDDQMFDLVHQMRTRIIKNSAFHGDRVLAAISVRRHDGSRHRRCRVRRVPVEFQEHRSGRQGR